VDDPIKEVDRTVSVNTENRNPETGEMAKEPGTEQLISEINPVPGGADLETPVCYHVIECIDQRDVRNEDVTEEPVGPSQQSRTVSEIEGNTLFRGYVNF